MYAVESLLFKTQTNEDGECFNWSNMAFLIFGLIFILNYYHFKFGQLLYTPVFLTKKLCFMFVLFVSNLGGFSILEMCLAFLCNLLYF